jgi:uncharacterized protein involved in exopolysaccharide biosynthesis
MEENKNYTPEVINLRLIVKKTWDNRKLFYKILPIVFVLSSLYIVCIPRYYSSETKLVPEIGNPMNGGTLGDLASSFGIDLGQMQTNDAINPLLYPDLLEDNGFATSMFNIRVKSQDGEIDTNYHDYLKSYQKEAWWNYPIKWVKNLFKPKEESGGKGEFDPYNLSKKEDAIAENVRRNIQISIDKKSGIITINVKAQDPLICKTLTDSIKDRLQAFITDYRTNKARIDYEYYEELAKQAKREYEKARQQYGSLSDANSKVALRSVELKMEDMENDMQLKFNAYTTINTQLQAAKAKVQEKTPAFTVLKGAAVPIKPAGPKRMIFVAAMLFLAFTCTILYIHRKDLIGQLKA